MSGGPHGHDGPHGHPPPALRCSFSCNTQVLSNSSVSSGVGVYWMFYSGGDYEPVLLPEGFPGSSGSGGDGSPVPQPPQPIEGLRLRPGLAMSQVRLRVDAGVALLRMDWVQMGHLSRYSSSDDGTVCATSAGHKVRTALYCVHALCSTSNGVECQWPACTITESSTIENLNYRESLDGNAIMP